MKRIGYDGSKYQFRDVDGSIWESAEGSRYGRLTQVSGPDPTRALTLGTERMWAPVEQTECESSTENDEESQRESTEQPPRRRFTDFAQILPETEPIMHNDDWKMIAPFLLLVCLVILLVWRMLRVNTAPNAE